MCFTRMYSGRYGTDDSRPSLPKMAQHRNTDEISNSISTGPNSSTAEVTSNYPVIMNLISMQYAGRLMVA